MPSDFFVVVVVAAAANLLLLFYANSKNRLTRGCERHNNTLCLTCSRRFNFDLDGKAAASLRRRNSYCVSIVAYDV